MNTNRRRLLVTPLAYLLFKPLVDFVNARAAAPRRAPCLVVLFQDQNQYVGGDHGPMVRNWVPAESEGKLVFPRVTKSLEPVGSYMTYVIRGASH